MCCSAEERTPSADDAVHVTAKKDGQTITVDAVFKVVATQRQAWDVLTDFAHMPNFVSNLESSKVVSRSGNVLQVAQKGRRHTVCFHLALTIFVKLNWLPIPK